jgi:hypothetical protein
MSQLTRLVLGFTAALLVLTVAHGALNHGWFEDTSRARLTIAHLPVT